ncbi:hypothetical protein AB3Z07_06140 [Metabacillus halosaccharovorans]|uniref:YfhD family protein n=1 Tax=Metabacillus halosaccharovorans TaxID=930124 RepID=A0ABT3DNN6_9BACI|nr:MULTISPECIES: hypothetical protein [Bacillaceae]MCM3440319.1 hypothetical protein [Metabacillus halosaccharovorans]MCV9888632.1 hypothetical protein [Metabacillus halosaccharovorans]
MDREKVQQKKKNNPDRFKKDRESQQEVDQLVMPIDDLPLEDIKEEKREERDKHDTKDQSSSEKKYKP